MMSGADLPAWVNNEEHEVLYGTAVRLGATSAVLSRFGTTKGFVDGAPPPTGKFISSRCIVILLLYNLFITIYLLSIYYDIFYS